MKKEKTTEEVVVADTITIEIAIMTIVTETIKIETETTIEKIMKEIIKIGRQESIKTEIMEIDRTKKEIMKKEIIIKNTSQETEKKTVNQETKIMTEEKEVRKSITPKMSPEKINQ